MKPIAPERDARNSIPMFEVMINDGVAEVDRATLTVGQAAVVEHLQQQVEHVRVRLLDLVEQHDRVRVAAHALGELPGLVVADVSRRGADEPRHGVPLAELAHVEADHLAVSSSNSDAASALASSVLPTPVGPRNRKLPTGRCGSPMPVRLRRTALATAVTASSCPIDPLVQLVLEGARDAPAPPRSAG